MLKSTRSNLIVKPSQAILKGLSSDGGLFVFDTFNSDFFKEELKELNYQELCSRVFQEFLTDYTKEQIDLIISKSYNQTKFQGNIVDVVAFNKHAYLNLYNGNTFAFKDLALSCLPHLMDEAKKINRITKKTVILTATSGDTGSATLEGFKDSEDTFVIVLYPANGVSEFQELQMKKYVSDTSFIIPVIGNFDDCQRIVKEIFMTLEPTNINLSSANSINIGRIIPQTVYYFYAYLELVRQKEIEYGDYINVTVPTGNFGNIYSAFIAKKMGVPIKNLIVASNENNVLTEVFNEGTYNTNRMLHKTISPSMDIVVSSNFERYLFAVLDNDSSQVKQSMDLLKEEHVLHSEEVKSSKSIYAYFADETKTKETIQAVFEKDSYLIDPHTAVAKYVSRKYQEETNDSTYMLVVSTANPYKFSDAVLESLQLTTKNNLETKFKELETFTKCKIDNRMFDVLKVKKEVKELKIHEVYKKIRKIIGDLDVKS